MNTPVMAFNLDGAPDRVHPTSVTRDATAHPTQIAGEVQNCRCRAFSVEDKVESATSLWKISSLRVIVGFPRARAGFGKKSTLAFEVPTAIVQATGNTFGFCGLDALGDQ